MPQKQSYLWSCAYWWSRCVGHSLPLFGFATGRRCGRRVRRGLEVSNGEEQREGILITSAAAPAISTYETDRAKHQLMQQYPHRDPARSHLSSEQQPFWLQKWLRSAKRLWWKVGGVLVLSIRLNASSAAYLRFDNRFYDANLPVWMRVEAKKRMDSFLGLSSSQQQIWWTNIHMIK